MMNRTVLNGLLVVGSSIALIIGACSSDEEMSCEETSDSNHREWAHFNIVLASDFTNRISTQQHIKSVHDTTIVRTLINAFRPQVLKMGGRIVQQRDVLRFRMMNSLKSNDAELNHIDLRGFQGNQARLIEYLNKDLTSDLEKLNQGIRRLYEYPPQFPSGDVYSLFEDRLKESITCLDTSYAQYGGVSRSDYHRNILILLTDGYIEYGSPKTSGGRRRYLDASFIQHLRDRFKGQDATADLEEFLEREELGLVPFKSEVMKHYEVLVLEFDDRSVDKRTGSARKNPSDFDINLAVWSKWLSESGVKKYRIERACSTPYEAERAIISFLESSN